MKHSDSRAPLLDLELPIHPLGSFRYRRIRTDRSDSGARSCTGGHTYLRGGYVIEYRPDHPANRSRSVPQHRLVMECILGRLLTEDEVVHHKNRIRSDNRACNLLLMTREEHIRLHAEEDETWAGRIPLTDEQVREALRGRSTLEAASILGVHHQTLRYRFDHLLTKRRSPGSDFPAEFVKLARLLAADPNIGQREACHRLSVTHLTLRKCLSRHGIEWVSAPSGRPTRDRPVWRDPG